MAQTLDSNPESQQQRRGTIITNNAEGVDAASCAVDLGIFKALNTNATWNDTQHAFGVGTIMLVCNAVGPVAGAGAAGGVGAGDSGGAGSADSGCFGGGVVLRILGRRWQPHKYL